MKIALYKNTEYDYISVMQSDTADKMSGYIRVSEYLEADFEQLSKADVTKKEIAAIDKAINKFMAETELKLGELNQKKAELLAICDQSGE